MNIGFWSCIILVIPFVIIGVLFAIFKEKATKFVSGFNSFSKEYWISNYEMVKKVLPNAELYVYEDDDTKLIDGFIGLTDSYIEGLFVKDIAQSKGIGKQLLDYVKRIKSTLCLSVYQENIRAVHFYQREQFQIQSENIDDNTDEKEFYMTWSI